jgi:hypothetical protein
MTEADIRAHWMMLPYAPLAQKLVPFARAVEQQAQRETLEHAAQFFDSVGEPGAAETVRNYIHEKKL